VAPHLAGIPELVTSGADGLLFPPAHWSALAECLATLLSDPELRGRLGAAARDRVRGEFSMERAVEPLVARLCESGTPAPNPRVLAPAKST
jgi:glycosyltransferase involved in cell wall biosynthesis